MNSTCVCAHDRSAHEHHRQGSDCALCAQGECRRYRSASRLPEWIARLTHRPEQRDSRTGDSGPVIKVA